MEKNKIAAKLTISRPSYGDGHELICLTVHDENAGIEAFELEMTYDNFAKVLTGLSRVNCDLVFSDLTNLGKTKVRDSFVFKVNPHEEYSNRDKAAHIKACELVEDGWQVSTYFGSRNSFFNKDGIQYATANIFKYI